MVTNREPFIRIRMVVTGIVLRTLVTQDDCRKASCYIHNTSAFITTVVKEALVQDPLYMLCGLGFQTIPTLVQG